MSCASPTVIAGAFPIVTPYNNAAASADGTFSDSVCGSGSSFRAVWYTYTVPASVTRLRMTGTESIAFDLVITVLRGTCGAFAAPLLCVGGDGSDYFVEGLTPGETLYLLLTSYNDDGIAGTFTIDHPTPTGDFCFTSAPPTPCGPVAPEVPGNPVSPIGGGGVVDGSGGVIV